MLCLKGISRSVPVFATFEIQIMRLSPSLSVRLFLHLSLLLSLHHSLPLSISALLSVP